MAIKKVSSITIIFNWWAFLRCLFFEGARGNELYMKNVMTSSNIICNHTISDKPIYFKVISMDLDYYLEVSLGTPPQKVHLLLDTGGREPWYPCSNHHVLGPGFDSFHPSMSSSFETISCNSHLCKPYALSSLPCNFDHPALCNFSETYYNGVTYVGLLSQDAFSLGDHVVQIPNFKFGCIYKDTEGYRFPNGRIYGNIGFGPQPRCAFDQLALIYRSYLIMTYCLASVVNDVEATSWMSLGGQSTQNLSFVPLVGLDHTPIFSVDSKGITIENVDIDLSNITTLSYDPISQVGGFILDTGVVATWLQEPLHSRFMTTFVAAMEDKAHHDIESIRRDDYEVCYTLSSDLNVSDIQIPNITFHLENDVHLHLGFENLFWYDSYSQRPTSDNRYYWCLAFQRIKGDDDKFHELGGILQQNFHVEVDYENRKVGFSPCKCKSLKV